MTDSLPDPTNPDEAIPWIRDNLRDGWTANSDAVRTLLAEYDRMKLELQQRVAWELYREDCGREDDECYFHSAVQAQLFLDREESPTDGPNVAVFETLKAEARRWIDTGTGLIRRDRPPVQEPPTFPDPASHD